MDKNYIITDGMLQHKSNGNISLKNYNPKFKYVRKYKSENGNWIYVYDSPYGRIGTTNRSSDNSYIDFHATRAKLGRVLNFEDLQNISIGNRRVRMEEARKKNRKLIDRSIRRSKVKKILKKTKTAASSAIEKGKKAASSLNSKLRSIASSSVKKVKAK